MKVKDIIDQFIAGDWGEETCSNETPCAVTCVRGADIIPISEYNFSAIPIRYITQQSYLKNRLQVGDIILQKRKRQIFTRYRPHFFLSHLRKSFMKFSLLFF